MPRELEERLKKEARKKGLTGEKFNAYVYGTLDRLKKEQEKKKHKKG